MNPDDITLINTSQQFEYEKFSREVDTCNDVDELRQMCKFLIKLEMKTRANYSVMLHDLMCDPSIPESGVTHNNS